MATQNPARSRPLSRNVVRLMKQSRASPLDPNVIKAARKMGAKELAYCEKQGEIFMSAVDMDVPISRFASLYMNSQVAGLLDVSFSQANGIDSDDLSAMIQLPMLLESPELIVSLVVWLNEVSEVLEADESNVAAILKALSKPETAPSFSQDRPSISEDQIPAMVRQYEYAYWLGYIYRYECLLHEESSRMVFSVLDEPMMRESYDQLRMRNMNLAECAPEICKRLDLMIVNKL